MNFYSIIQKLNNHSIPFVITGSYAVYLYTRKRVFNDIDIAVQQEDLQRIEELFGQERDFSISPYGHRYDRIELGAIEFGTFDICHNSFCIDMGVSVLQANARIFSTGEENFKVIDPNNLIVLKLLFSRNSHTKSDWEDIKLLDEKLNIDWSLIAYKCLESGIQQNLLEFLSYYQLVDIEQLVSSYLVRKNYIWRI